MLPNKVKLEKTLRLVDELIHGGDYYELERLSGGVRMNADEIKEAILAYPELLGLRPNYELNNDDFVYVTGSCPSRWAVDLDLWGAGGQRSDLTAQLTIIDTNSALYAFEIDNIHVL